MNGLKMRLVCKFDVFVVVVQRVREGGRVESSGVSGAPDVFDSSEALRTRVHSRITYAFNIQTRLASGAFLYLCPHLNSFSHVFTFIYEFLCWFLSKL